MKTMEEIREKKKRVGLKYRSRKGAPTSSQTGGSIPSNPLHNRRFLHQAEYQKRSQGLEKGVLEEERRGKKD